MFIFIFRFFFAFVKFDKTIYLCLSILQDKPVIIPVSNKQKNYMAAIPTFVRNVMGSSAGAGSGEFHVYRHLRRKEYARQKHIQHKSKQVKFVYTIHIFTILQLILIYF